MLLHYSEWVKIQSSCLQNYSYQKHKVCFSSGMQETTYPNIYRWNSSIMVEFKRFYLSNKLRGNLECIYYFYELKWIKEKIYIVYIFIHLLICEYNSLVGWSIVYPLWISSEMQLQEIRLQYATLSIEWQSNKSWQEKWGPK